MLQQNRTSWTRSSGPCSGPSSGSWSRGSQASLRARECPGRSGEAAPPLPGIGSVCATTLLSEMPELGRMTAC